MLFVIVSLNYSVSAVSRSCGGGKLSAKSMLDAFFTGSLTGAFVKDD